MSYKKIIFDLDGVITSEKEYWHCAALTIYEMITGDVLWCAEHKQEIYDEVFQGEETIRRLKSLGINSNWDLTYVVYLAYLAKKEKYAENIFPYILENFRTISTKAPDLFTEIALKASKLSRMDFDYVKRKGPLWNILREMFQGWYLGDMPGKEGLIHFEKPLLELHSLKNMLNQLREKGYIFGIGTGRNRLETENPLKSWGIYHYFDKDSIITYDDVEAAEREYKEKAGALVKPHPFMFLKSAFGKNISVLDIIDNNIPKISGEIFVVGDAAADLLAAKSANFPFIAVLTGVSGKDAYDYFKNERADYIIDTVLDIGGII